MLADSPGGAGTDDPVEHYGRLLFELSDVVDSVQGDRRLAMFRAHQHGMEVAEIARRANVEITVAEGAIDTLSREPDVNNWQIACWSPRYRQP